MQAVFYLQSRLGVNNISILIRVGDGGAVVSMREPQSLWRGRKQAGFKTRDGLVYQVVDRVDNVIYERLRSS